MKQLIFNSEYFQIKDTLECGQVFRFIPHEKGYLVFSLDKCAYCYNDGENTIVECEDGDYEYFHNYFDLSRDYSCIYEKAVSLNIGILSHSANYGKGIRILNQDVVEVLFSFIVSQNNNIPRIKGIIERLCAGLGKKVSFKNGEYFAFPTVKDMANAPLEFYKSIGLGYRAEYILRLAKEIEGGLDVVNFNTLDTLNLKRKLISLYGVGPKVADCVALFGYHRSDSFPVDTWIEKVYREDFNGKLKNRNQITEWFLSQFGINAGYYQQYLFHYKRIKEKKGEKA